jgi:hypothetical protein
MIEGLKLDFSVKELKEHLDRLARHHDERRVFYERQAQTLKDGGAEENANFTGGNPRQQLEQKAKEHSNKSALFQVFSDHLVAGEVYRLQEQDLIRLELLSRW